jgi:hypothetical protein
MIQMQTLTIMKRCLFMEYCLKQNCSNLSSKCQVSKRRKSHIPSLPSSTARAHVHTHTHTHTHTHPSFSYIFIANKFYSSKILPYGYLHSFKYLFCNSNILFSFAFCKHFFRTNLALNIISQSKSGHAFLFTFL